MLTGLGVEPKRYDPFVDNVDMRELHGHFAGLRDLIVQTVARMPAHGAYLEKIAKTAGCRGLLTGIYSCSRSARCLATASARRIAACTLDGCCENRPSTSRARSSDSARCLASAWRASICSRSAASSAT